MKNQNNKVDTQNKLECHEDRFTGRRSSQTPFILLPAHFSSRPHPSSLRGEWLNFFGCGESSLRPSAPSSLVALGGGRSERRAGRRRTGQVGALLISNNSKQFKASCFPLQMRRIPDFLFLPEKFSTQFQVPVPEFSRNTSTVPWNSQ